MINYRKFDKESDYDLMRYIVQHNCSETGQLYPQIHIGDLDFERYAFEESPEILYKTIWFLCENNKEIAFITVEEDEFHIYVLCEYKKYIKDIIKYVENNCYTKGIKVTTEANSEDKFLSSILEESGYTKTEDFRFHGICELAKIQQQTPLPNGFNIRLTEKKDIERRVELFGLPTGGIGTSIERYKRMMNSPSYSHALDLVVENDNGEVIAYCTVWDDPISKIGLLEPVACVAEYRRKGIMKSTLLYGMNILKQRGDTHIYVGTSGKNIASQALYKSVGFVQYGEECEWQKIL